MTWATRNNDNCAFLTPLKDAKDGKITNCFAFYKNAHSCTSISRNGKKPLLCFEMRCDRCCRFERTPLFFSYKAPQNDYQHLFTNCIPYFLASSAHISPNLSSKVFFSGSNPDFSASATRRAQSRSFNSTLPLHLKQLSS